MNWEIFISSANKYLNRSPTRSLDSQGLGVGTLDSYLMVLSEFWTKDSNPRVINNFTLNHIMLSYLIIFDEWLYYDLLEKTQGYLKFIKCQDFNPRGQISIIATGNLYDWKQCIVNICIPEFCTKMWWDFNKRGFASLFQDYKIDDNQQIVKR